MSKHMRDKNLICFFFFEKFEILGGTKYKLVSKYMRGKLKNLKKVAQTYKKFLSKSEREIF